MARKVSPTSEQIIAALTAAKGRVYLAAEALGVVPSTIYRAADRNPAINQAIGIEKGKRLDRAENILWEAVERGEAWAVCFFLKTQGKERGYIERQDVKVDNAITLEVVEEIVDAPSSGGSTPPCPA